MSLQFGNVECQLVWDLLYCVPSSLESGWQQRLVSHCQTTSFSAAHATHCATYCTPCRPLIRAFSGWIRTPPPTGWQELPHNWGDESSILPPRPSSPPASQVQTPHQFEDGYRVEGVGFGIQGFRLRGSATTSPSPTHATSPLR